jgi:hypothetical protein
MKTLELWWPLKHYVITQGFGGNDNASYAKGGLLGHPALDLVTTYNDVIRLAAEGSVYKTINFNNPSRGAYAPDNRFFSVCERSKDWLGATGLLSDRAG